MKQIKNDNKFLLLVAVILAIVALLYTYGIIPKFPEPSKQLPETKITESIVIAPVKLIELDEVKVSHFNFTLICKMYDLSINNSDKTFTVTCEKNKKQYIFPQEQAKLTFLKPKVR